ncbi:MAG: SDR family oxidoreductase [Anaerolineales bacterium]
MDEWEDLDGRTALVTGGARRIGKALVLGLAERGANVVVHYGKSAADASETARLARGFGVQASAVAADLTDPIQSEALWGEAERTIGPIDILVNSASTFGPGTLETTSRAEWDEHLAVHLSAPFALCQAFARQHAGSTTGSPSARPGVVLNLLDWRALRPGAAPFAYTVSKAALAAMTQSLAAALAPGIRVNGLALGAILPPESSLPDPDLLRHVPLGRWGTVEEAVHAAVFLIAGSDFMTGAVVHVDGGRHLH